MIIRSSCREGKLQLFEATVDTMWFSGLAGDVDCFMRGELLGALSGGRNVQHADVIIVCSVQF